MEIESFKVRVFIMFSFCNKKFSSFSKIISDSVRKPSARFKAATAEICSAFITLWEYYLLQLGLPPTRYKIFFISLLVRAQVSRSYSHLKNQSNNLSTSLKILPWLVPLNILSKEGTRDCSLFIQAAQCTFLSLVLFVIPAAHAGFSHVQNA